MRKVAQRCWTRGQRGSTSSLRFPIPPQVHLACRTRGPLLTPGAARPFSTASSRPAFSPEHSSAPQPRKTSASKFSGRSDILVEPTDTPHTLYQKLVDRGELKTDAEQEKTVEMLTAIFHSVLGSKKESTPATPPRGLYIYGPAGSGKSLCMDLFHLCISQQRPNTERTHFHEFVYRLHRRLNELSKGENISNSSSTSTFAGIPKQTDTTRQRIERVAKEVAEHSEGLLCFDEFAITTIQDCTMLCVLFQELFRQNVVFITTSNRAPQDLYEDGLNRHLYLPDFLNLLHTNCDIRSVGFETGIDYRQAGYNSLGQELGRLVDEEGTGEGGDSGAYVVHELYFPDPEVADAGAGEGVNIKLPNREQAFAWASSTSSLEPIADFDLSSAAASTSSTVTGSSTPIQIPISYGRTLECKTSGPGWVLFDFRELFGGTGGDTERKLSPRDSKERPRHSSTAYGHYSADDFNAICRQFHTVLLENIPKLTTEEHNEAKRFTNFLDCAYENHCRLVLLNMHCAKVADVFQELRSLESLRMADFGQHEIPAGAADQDTTKDASAIVQAIKKLKERNVGLEQLEKDKGETEPHVEKSSEDQQVTSGAGSSTGSPPSQRGPSSLKSDMKHPMSLSDFDPEKDMQIWKQDAQGMPQVTKSWDERRRASQFLWEAADPTAEQQTFKGVFAAAIASLHETGFAVKRAVSRLHEMQSRRYLEVWQDKRGGETKK
ncbi:unnamed protein product [Amoebophrya sp. A120]|nr:unnamed protein product [Amoebophrya sp. A120]|eukprot:GSA120T00023615001.1